MKKKLNRKKFIQLSAFGAVGSGIQAGVLQLPRIGQSSGQFAIHLCHGLCWNVRHFLVGGRSVGLSCAGLVAAAAGDVLDKR